MARTLQVLIIDDHPVVRFGVGQVLRQDKRFVLCGEAGDSREAMKLVREKRPDLVILDLVLGGRDDLELLREIHALRKSSRILVYSAQPEMIYASRAFAAGAAGYMMKDEGIEKVPEALAVLAGGECYASPAVQRALFQKTAGGETGRLREELSDRELQVLRLLGAGRSTVEMAAELSLSIKTIGTYRERLKNKLGAEDARQLERRAVEFVRTGKIPL